MKPIQFLVILLASLGLCHEARAAEPACDWWQSLWHPLSRPQPCCPDDYCPKPLPCAPPVSCRGPNDYCPKPLPTTCPAKCFGPDDYCPKKCPIFLPPCYPPWYTCGPAQGCRQPQ